MDRLRAHVKARGLKSSVVRDAVARVALDMDGHFSVDELRRRLPSAHLSSVYRILRVLVDAGLLQEAPSKGDWQCYERAFERNQHNHLSCTRCGCVVEFTSEVMDEAQRNIAASFRFALTNHVHHLYGVCQVCQRGND